MQGQGLHHQLISCQSHFYAKPFHPLCQFHLYEIYWLTLVSVFICTNIHSDIAATSTSFSAMYVAEKRKELLLLLLCRSSLLLLCRSSYFYFYVEAERERAVTRPIRNIPPLRAHSALPRRFFNFHFSFEDYG